MEFETTIGVVELTVAAVSLAITAYSAWQGRRSVDQYKEAIIDINKKYDQQSEHVRDLIKAVVTVARRT
jgi:uncharacterized membrane protein YebE (DUF533 family)